MLNTLCNLEEISRADTAEVGEKAAALGELIHAGINVPGGFVLTTGAYAQFIDLLRPKIDGYLTAEVIEDPLEIETVAQEVRQWIVQTDWPDSLRTQLAAALTHFSSGLDSFSARTSLPSAELATAFGAGVQRAALGLTGQAGVERGVASCWAALWNSRSMYYRHRKKIPQTRVALAVVVQPMIPAEAAGVMFTQNPVSGQPDEIQIDSIWGLGAPVTQGRVQPDRFLVAKSRPMIREYRIEEKSVKLAVAPGGDVEQQGVPVGQIEAPSLTDAQVIELSQLGMKIEEFFGQAQDIEWALSGNKFYVLQARPIAVRPS